MLAPAEPILVTEAQAAALCALSPRRFRVLCPVPRARAGRARLLPLDAVRAWALNWWGAQAGEPAGALAPARLELAARPANDEGEICDEAAFFADLARGDGAET